MTKCYYVPQYTITDKIVNLVSGITEVLTRITIDNNMNENQKLQRDNRIKTIQASLAIEKKSLSLEQVADIINGTRISGEPNEIYVVKNAYQAYEILLQLNPISKKDLLKVHRILMKNLTKNMGRYRDNRGGLFAGEKLVHMAPPSANVPRLMTELFAWLKKSDAHPLIKSCVFHCEFEIIHPFVERNGQIGRMWQTLLLYQWNSLFGWLPVETIIRKRQQEYYDALAQCGRIANSSAFVEFILTVILDLLLETAELEQVNKQLTNQVKRLLNCLGNKEYSTRELMELVGLKHRPTFRKNYLMPALELGVVEMTIPEKPNSKKQRYKCKKQTGIVRF